MRQRKPNRYHGSLAALAVHLHLGSFSKAEFQPPVNIGQANASELVVEAIALKKYPQVLHRLCVDARPVVGHAVFQIFVRLPHGNDDHATLFHLLNAVNNGILDACDIVPGKARSFLDKYGLTAVPDFENVMDLIRNVEMDGASVCTYNTTHAECAIALLEAGVHVLCEKPMSFTLQEAVEMVRASRKANKFLTIGFQPRYDFMRKKVDDIIDSGALGKVYYVQSGGGRRRGIPAGAFVDKAKAGYGYLGDIGCYSIDECLHAIHYPKPLTVSAIATDYFGKNPKYWPGADTFDVDDFSVALVRMEGDVTYLFKQSWAMHADTLGDTLWLGTEGGSRSPTDLTS